MSAVSSLSVRLGATILLGGVLTALLVRTAPGFGADEQMLDARRDSSWRERVREQRLRESDPASFVLQWLGGYLRGDLGISPHFHRPIRSLIAERAAPTLLAGSAGLAGAWFLGLGLALAGRGLRSRLLDGSAFAASSLLQCLPAGALALLLLLAGARGPGAVALAVAVALLPRVWITSRAILAAASASPSTLLGRAQGFGPWRILFRRVLPLARRELLALAAVSVSMALSVSIPLETILDVPGLGQLAWQAALARDLPLLVNLMTAITVAVSIAGALSEAGPRHGVRL